MPLDNSKQTFYLSSVLLSIHGNFYGKQTYFEDSFYTLPAVGPSPLLSQYYLMVIDGFIWKTCLKQTTYLYFTGTWDISVAFSYIHLFFKLQYQKTCSVYKEAF